MVQPAAAGLTPLPQEFFAADAPYIARELIGRVLVRIVDGVELRGAIVETEAYMPHDPASHSFRGLTKRNSPMFGEAGAMYVYRCYGMHWLANIVTGPPDHGAAVLLRAVQPVCGQNAMRERRGDLPDRLLCSGPGRLAEAFGFTAQDNCAVCARPELFVSVERNVADIRSTPRIGISVATELNWRFSVAGSPYVSSPRPKPAQGA